MVSDCSPLSEVTPGQLEIRYSLGIPSWDVRDVT